MPAFFQSLRFRLLLPIVGVALAASLVVAMASYVIGDRWAREQLAMRYVGIETTLAEGSFPLNRQVLRLLADLTDTHLIAARSNGAIVASSLTTGKVTESSVMDQIKIDVTGPQAPTGRVVSIDDNDFRFGWFYRKSNIEGRSDDAAIVVVLFDEGDMRDTRIRAASLPLATGLSTIVLLASVMFWLTDRIVRRLSLLRRQVDRVAEGHFDADVPLGEHDEIGMLGISVNRMAGQLSTMWKSIERQQGQKLLHQVAGGLAHSLRNSLTGATMAIELHQRDCKTQDESLSVALDQLGQTESYVRRLLQVAAGKQEDNQRRSVANCIDDIRPTLAATANHLRVRLDWHISGDASTVFVADGPSLTSAIANLTLNAMEAAREVEVFIVCNRRLRVDVLDNGPGPPASVAEDIFEPFVTSKPEGLGLGLPLVARSARRLGGTVKWTREDNRTRFTLDAEISALA